MSIERIREVMSWLDGWDGNRSAASFKGFQSITLGDIRALLDELSRRREVERRAKEVIRPFALLVERQDASDLAFLKEQGGGEKDMVHYAPDSAKVHSSGELRGALYLTKGDFRELAKFYRVLSEREGQE